MNLWRTVRGNLDLDIDDAALLRDTIVELLWAATHLLDHAVQGEYKSMSTA